MYRTILAALDLEHGEHTNAIIGIAKGLADGGEVFLLNVVPAGPAVVSQFLDASYEKLASGDAKKQLAKLKATLDSEKIKSSNMVRFGTVYEEILAAAEKIGANLIVIGSHQPNAAGFLLGTNAARVVRHATCSVFVVR